MNIERAKLVLAAIDKHPDNFDMRWFIAPKGQHAMLAFEDAADLTQALPTAGEVVDGGTTCCIAGWAAVLAGPEHAHYNTPRGVWAGVRWGSTGAAWLELDEGEASALFYTFDTEDGRAFFADCIEAGEVLNSWRWSQQQHTSAP